MQARVNDAITSFTATAAAACLVALGCACAGAGQGTINQARGEDADAQRTNAQAPASLVPDADEIAALRAEGPAGLERLLARFDSLSSLQARAALEPAIDAVAAQRYATVSRLYWYTDLDAARAAAHAAEKPILSLRMLGQLDRDLSCANSRLFRSVLYSNAEVSAFLRDNFVLHWSSERPVPVVSIDFGDGRTIETTIAGNSAHYILDRDGNPVDVLPGLYGPAAFRRELEAALPLARDAHELSGKPRARRLVEYHRARRAAAEQRWSTPGVAVAPRRGTPTPPNGSPFPSSPTAPIVLAEVATIGKAMVELPIVRELELGAQTAVLADDAQLFETLGASRLDDARLDATSRALIERLAPIDWAADPRALEGAALDALIARLESHVATDTALNDLKYRWAIQGWFIDAEAPKDFLALNARIYSELFLTPATDAWLGMTPGGFTGLPGDGVAFAN